MSMTYEAVQQQNKQLVSQLCSEDRGISKHAADTIQTWFKTYQQQNGIGRQLVPPEPVTDADFSDAVDTRAPFVIRPITPRSSGALSVNFDTFTVAEYMNANKYRIYMNRVTTPVYTIDKIYLTLYKGSLVEIFRDVMLQDILATEDNMVMNVINAALPAKDEVDSAIGCKRYIDAGASVTASNVMHAVSGMSYSSDNLRPNRAVVHATFWWKLIAAFRTSNEGPALTEKAIMGDTEGLEKGLAGLTWITALDRTVIPLNRMYILPRTEYVGNFLTYEDVQVFTEMKQGIVLEMFAHETIGFAAPNKSAFFAADFTGTPAGWTTE